MQARQVQKDLRRKGEICKREAEPGIIAGENGGRTDTVLVLYHGGLIVRDKVSACPMKTLQLSQRQTFSKQLCRHAPHHLVTQLRPAMPWRSAISPACFNRPTPVVSTPCGPYGESSRN
jgi:hypothetical protein